MSSAPLPRENNDQGPRRESRKRSSPANRVEPEIFNWNQKEIEKDYIGHFDIEGQWKFMRPHKNRRFRSFTKLKKENIM